MPNVQSQFEKFHANIKLDQDDEKATLQEKRQTLVNALRAKLPDDVPAFVEFNQGSYSMHTGVVPLDGNYDIDVGLVFDCKSDEYPDPVVLKCRVRDALKAFNRTVAIRRPCVTVNYMRAGVPEYHVDLAIYVKRDDGLLDLAKGKENSSAENRVWSMADPKGLTNKICTAFAGKDELAQYRRCIRYLKRWRDKQFSNGGAPLSIALTVAAWRWFSPRFSPTGKAADLVALRDWVTAMLSRFTQTWGEGGSLVWRLNVELPVVPYNDLMAGISDSQMTYFKEKLEKLCDVLNDAYADELPEKACERLQKQFGSDFEVPAKAATAHAAAAPFFQTGTSA